METIGKQKIWSFLEGAKEAEPVSCTDVRTDPGNKVQSYLELATKIAELQFMNRDHVLMFRGQDADHRNTKSKSSLKPSLFRPKSKGNPTSGTLIDRFARLTTAERLLVDEYRAAGLTGIERLSRHRLLRWSILQHYEVCETPLLDVTHSLRVAASFASETKATEAFVFVLGVPNLSGAITASAEAGIQIVRLSSVCPPAALRPHIQEGYLLGEYPEMAGFDQKVHYHHYEIDFGRRLVAKFRFNPQKFWKNDHFPQLSRHALYPPASADPLHRLANTLAEQLGT